VAAAVRALVEHNGAGGAVVVTSAAKFTTLNGGSRKQEVGREVRMVAVVDDAALALGGKLSAGFS
jgi:hypothetical protein